MIKPNQSVPDDYEFFLGLSILEIKKLADIFTEHIVWENNSYLDKDGEFLENLSLLGKLNENEQFHMTWDDEGYQCIDIKTIDGERRFDRGERTAIFESGTPLKKTYAEQIEDVFLDIKNRKFTGYSNHCKYIIQFEGHCQQGILKRKK